MPAVPVRAAAYTRTGILRRFLDLLAESLPSRVDSAFAQDRLGLKGGDVRAFLQSLRVLGLVDLNGGLSERARRTRGLSQRAAAIREGLAQAYPELTQRWDSSGGMPREEVEDFFKVEYGLSSSSAGPAAKLFCDLMLEYGRPPASRPAEPISRTFPEALPPGDPAPFRETAAVAVAPAAPERDAGGEVRLAALDAIKSALKIEINENWDPARIELVFDRMERLVQLVVGEPAAAAHASLSPHEKPR